MDQLRIHALLVAAAALVATSPAMAAPDHLPAEQVAAVNSVMLREMSQRNIVGAGLAIVRDGHILFADGYGFANRESDERVTADTRFMIASMTKMFLASAVMGLVAERRLSLDQPVGGLLPNIPEAWRTATVRQLLTHTSGIPSFTDFDTFPCPPGKPEADYQMGDVLQEVACLPMMFPAGTDFGYSESNYHLLAMLVESMSGQPYEQFMRERVIGRLKMRHTDFMKAPGEADTRAIGYRRIDGAIFRAPDLYPKVELGLVSNLADLARFDGALAAGTLLPKPVLEEMWKPTGIGRASYGMGFSSRPIGGRRQIGHTGGGPAASTAFARFQDDNITIILLTNSNQPPATITTLVDSVADVILPARAVGQ